MMILTCGCAVPYNEDDPDDKYCATWETTKVYPRGEIYSEISYGSLCDKHLVSYNGKRCKLGGEKL